MAEKMEFVMTEAKVLMLGDGRQNLDLDRLSRAKGWQRHPTNPLKVEFLSAYLLELWEVIVQALNKRLNLDEANLVLGVLQEIRTGLATGKWIKISGLYRMTLPVEKELNHLLSKKHRREGLIWFDALLNQLQDAEEGLTLIEFEILAAEAKDYLMEMGLSSQNAGLLSRTCDSCDILEAIDFLDYECDHQSPNIRESKQQNLMVVLAGIFELYSSRSNSEFSVMAKQALLNAKHSYPRVFEIGQSWHEGTEYTEETFVNILRATKRILTVLHAH